MKTCIHTQNFIEIEQSTAELWPKTIFNIAAVRHLIFKKNIFRQVTVIEFQICCGVLNFIEIG